MSKCLFKTKLSAEDIYRARRLYEEGHFVSNHINLTADRGLKNSNAYKRIDALMSLHLYSHSLLIDSNRLLRPVAINELKNETSSVFMRGALRRIGGQATREHILDCANIMRDLFHKCNLEYSVVCSELDQSFPFAVINASFHHEKPMTPEMIRNRLADLQALRNELALLGLIQMDDKRVDINLDKASEETLLMMTVYIRDSFKKYEVFEKLKRKLNLFSRIINKDHGFTHKQLRFDYENGPVFVSDNSQIIPLTALSSGEKHDFILFFELIFNADEHSLILIDEPEISLHVSWQVLFVDELLEICKETNLQVIIATHSPNIVNNRWDITFGLGEDESSV